MALIGPWGRSPWSDVTPPQPRADPWSNWPYPSYYPEGSQGPDAPPTTPPAAPPPVTPPSGARPNWGGFDLSKLGTASTSPKYAFASVAQQYPNTLAGLAQLFPVLQQQFPQFFTPWQLAADRIQYNPALGPLAPEWGGITGFDVLQGAQQGGQAWQWLPQGQGYSTPYGSPPAPPSPPPKPPPAPPQPAQPITSVPQGYEQFPWDALFRAYQSSASLPQGTVQVLRPNDMVAGLAQLANLLSGRPLSPAAASAPGATTLLGPSGEPQIPYDVLLAWLLGGAGPRR